MILAYNAKNKYRLSLRTLYGGKNIIGEVDDEEEENGTAT